MAIVSSPGTSIIGCDSMKDQSLIDRLIDLAEAERPALFVLSEDAKAEDLDEALRIISALPDE